jgi:hypothetical protein
MTKVEERNLPKGNLKNYKPGGEKSAEQRTGTLLPLRKCYPQLASPPSHGTWNEVLGGVRFMTLLNQSRDAFGYGHRYR